MVRIHCPASCIRHNNSTTNDQYKLHATICFISYCTQHTTVTCVSKLKVNKPSSGWRISNTFVLNIVNTGNKTFTFLNIQLAHTHGRHRNIYRHTHTIMTAGDTVLILSCDTQVVTERAAATCRYNDNVSSNIQFHDEWANYININLCVHNFCYKNICTCKCEHTKIMCVFSRENLEHLRCTKCINARGNSYTRHKT